MKKAIQNGFKRIQELVLLVNPQWKNTLAVRKSNVFAVLSFVMNVIQNGMKCINHIKENALK